MLDRVLREELKVSAGCTEPAAIAYAAAYAREKLGCEPQNVTVTLSSNVLKNALCVNVPNTDKSGIKMIVLMGMLFGKAEDKLTILKDISPKDILRLDALVEQYPIEIKVQKDAPTLYICIRLSNGQRFCEVVIEDFHDQIKSVETNESKEVFDMQSVAQKQDYDISFDAIWDFVTQHKYDKDLIASVKYTNSDIAEHGLQNECGLKIGKVIKNIEFIMPKFRDVVAKTVAGIDARMSGTAKNVVINSGSGNQGITATLPIVEMAKILQIEESKELDAIALSHLTSIFIRARQGKLSSTCGAVCACIGAAAGIAYLLGADRQQVEGCIKNLLCSSFGLFCDGAKTSCALKVNACLIAAIQTAFMAVQGYYLKENSGIISASLEETLDHLNQIESVFTASLDETIMQIAIKNLSK